MITLREKEKLILRNQLDGVADYCEGKITLNELFDRYMSIKYGLKPKTISNYRYMYDRYVRKTFGKRIITTIKYSDVKMFYYSLVKEMKIKVQTVGIIHYVLSPTFSMAVRDGIIRLSTSN